MALEKQTLTFPLFLGEDRGTDKKVVRESLLEARNVIHDKDGRLAKRPPMKREFEVSADSLLVSATDELCVTTDSVMTGDATGNNYQKSLDTQLASSVRGRRIAAFPSAGGSAINYLTWKGDLTVDIFDPEADVVRLQSSACVQAGSTRVVRGFINPDDAKYVAEDEQPTSTWQIYGRRGPYDFSGSTVIRPRSLGTRTAGGTITAVEVSVSKAQDVVALLTNAGEIELMWFESAQSIDTYAGGVKQAFSAGTDPARLGLCKSADEDEVKIITWNASTNTPEVWAFDALAFTYSGMTSLSTLMAALPSTPTDMISVAGTAGGFWAILQGAATDSWDYLIFSEGDDVNHQWCRIPKGGRLQCRGMENPADSKQYTVLRLGNTTGMVTAGGSTTEISDLEKFDIGSFVLVNSDLEFGTLLFPGEALDTGIATLGGISYIGASDPLKDGPTNARQYDILLPVGATVPSIALVRLFLPIQRQRLPVLPYGTSSLVATPHLWRSPSGKALYDFAPATVNLAEQASGSLNATATYRYRVASILDGGDGRIIYGPVTNPTAITLTGSNTGVVVTIPAVEPYTNAGVLRYDVYRNEADATVKGSSFQYVGSAYRSASTGIATFTDTVADDDRTEFLYDEQVLDSIVHEPPPPARDIWEHEGRVWLIPADDSSVVWYSRIRPDANRILVTPAGEGPSFSAANTILLDITSDVLRGTSFGGACIIFARGATWTIGGSGPDSTGLRGGFSSPQRLAIPSITDANSLVNLGEHLLYRADNSWVLLDRGFNAQDVGTMDESLKGASVKSAIKRDNDTAQILLGTSALVPVDALIFDVRQRQWFSWDYAVKLEQIIPREGDTGKIVGVEDSHVFMEPLAGGTNYTHIDSDNAGDLQNYHMSVETRWFNLNQFAGFQRLYEIAILGEHIDDHTLTVKIYYDYSDTAAETITKVIDTDVTPYLFKWQPKKQVSRAFKVRIEETDPRAPYYRSFTLTGFQATIGVKPRTHYSAGETIT